MARKKKRVVKKGRAKAKPFISSQKVDFSRVKFGLVVKNLVMFVLLFIISYILYKVSGNDVWINIFTFLWIVFLFISIAFFIALLVLLFMRMIKK